MKHKEKIIVAVIDSGVNINDEYFLKKDIETYRYEEGEFLPCLGDNNFHGTEVTKILFHEASDIKILSIQILDTDNKCKVKALIESIEFCIRYGVNIINLSLGCSNLEINSQNKLEYVCEKAYRKNIMLVAAEHNRKDTHSFPANFSQVIKVDSNENMEDLCIVNKEDYSVTFSNDFVYIADLKEGNVRKGTSYLCPAITALVACYYSYDLKMKQVPIMEFLFEILQHKGKYIFFDKKSEFKQIKGKEILFCLEDISIDIITIEYLSKSNKVSYFEYRGQDAKEVLLYSKHVDIFMFGELSYKFNQKYEKKINRLITNLLKIKISIIMSNPIISLYRRYQFYIESKTELKSMYK